MENFETLLERWAFELGRKRLPAFEAAVQRANATPLCSAFL